MGGQLTVNPSLATIVPLTNCTNTGLTLGTSTAYNQGVIDGITLLSASLATQTGYSWDLTGIDLSQTLPAKKSADSYTLAFTLTGI